FAVAYYLSMGTTPAGTVPLGAPRMVGPLSPGQSLFVTTPLTIPAATAAGSYRVVAVADAADSVREAIESNNVVATSPFRVCLPDLVISGLTAPAMANANTSVILTYAV